MNNKHDEPCLMLSHSQVSRFAAFGIIGMLFVFVAGYYLGKKNQSEELAECVKQDAFADHIYSSLCTAYAIDNLQNSQDSLVDDSIEEKDNVPAREVQDLLDNRPEQDSTAPRRQV